MDNVITTTESITTITMISNRCALKNILCENADAFGRCQITGICGIFNPGGLYNEIT